MKHFALLCALAVSFASGARADHPSKDSLALGKPETSLAGIDLRTATLEDVIRRYGPPTRQRETANEPLWRGYVWQLPGAKLELSVFGKGGGARVGDIYVEGVSREAAGSTGRGLRLGDDAEAVARLYGNKFYRWSGKRPSKERQEFAGVHSGERIYLQW